MSEIWSARAKYQEVSRELALRRNVYRRMVETKRMTQKQADRHLDLICAIVQDYYRLAHIEDNQKHAKQAAIDDAAEQPDELTILSGG